MARADDATGSAAAMTNPSEADGNPLRRRHGHGPITTKDLVKLLESISQPPRSPWGTPPKINYDLFRRMSEIPPGGVTASPSHVSKLAGRTSAEQHSSGGEPTAHVSATGAETKAEHAQQVDDAHKTLRVRMQIENNTLEDALRDYEALSDHIHTITADLCGAYGYWNERFHITDIQRKNYGDDQPVLRSTYMRFRAGKHEGTAVLDLSRWRGKYYVTYVLEVNP